MSEEKNGMSPENNVTPAAETPQERPKRGRPRKVDANGNPVAPRRRGRPPKVQPETAPAAVAPQTAPAEEKAPQTEETKPRRGRKPAVRQQETPQNMPPAAEPADYKSTPAATVEQRELDFVPIPVPGQPDIEYVPPAPEPEQPRRPEALMPREELLEEDPREHRDRNNGRNNRNNNNNNRRNKFGRHRDRDNYRDQNNPHNFSRKIDQEEAEYQQLCQEGSAPSLNISELQEKSMQELTAMGEALGIEGIGALEKSTLIFEILRANAEKSGLMYGSGYLEVLPDGFGFLRSLTVICPALKTFI